MRVAIVGAGVSGLVAAHLLHPEHDVTVLEAGAYAGGHTNTITVETDDAAHEIDTGFIVFNDRNYPRFEALLAELGVAAQPSPMSFGVSDGDFEYASTSLNGLYAKRSHMVSPAFQRMVADVPRFQRAARALLASDEEPTLRDWLATLPLSEAFVERVIVPQASAVWSADPEQMWTFPARFLVQFFDNHGMLGLSGRPRWRTVAGGSRRYVEALTAPFADRIRLNSPVHRIERDEHGVDVDGERFDEVVIAVHADQALAMLAEPTAAEHELLRAFPYQANEAVLHTDRSLASDPPARVGELELPPRRGLLRAGHGHVPHEQPAVAGRRSRVLRHAQPHRGDRPGQGHPHDRLRAPRLHPRGARRPGAPRGDQRPQPHPLLRRVLGLGLPRGRRRQRAPRRRRDLPRAGAGMTASALYEGTIRHRRFSVRGHELNHRVSMAYLDLDELPGLSIGNRFRRSDHFGDPARPLKEVVRERVGPGAPTGPVRLLTHLRTLGHCFNPVSFFYLYEPDGETLGAVVAEVTSTPWGERTTYVLRRDDDERVLAGGMDKAMHVSPFMGMDQRYVWRVAEPGPTLSVHIENREDGDRVFDATLNLHRAPLSRRGLVRHTGATLRVLALIYAHAAVLKLKGVPVHRRPEVTA